MQIIVRAAEPQDFAAVQCVYAGPIAQAGTLQLPWPSLELWRQRLSIAVSGRHSLVACVDGEVVAQLGLCCHTDQPRRQHTADLGMGVRDDWQGRGVGGALLAAAIELAEQWLQITHLEIETYADNQRALHLYERHGFVREGLHRAHAFRNGEYVDVISMARLS